MRFTRREFLSTSAAAAAGALVFRAPLRAMPPQLVTRFQDLRDGVGVFTGQGGTIGWLVTNDGALAVDSQYPATAGACVSGLKDRSPKGIALLINTHHHADHVAGNPAFKPVVGKIVQQERCAKYHRDTTQADGSAPRQAYADVTFATNWSTALGGEKVTAQFYGPGHTGGDAIVVFEKANVVHMGDLMFNKMHPFIDRANGASIVNWTKALTKIADEHKDAVFIFGHAKPGLAVSGTRADLVFFRDYLSAVIDAAQNGIRAGQSLQDVAKMGPLPGFEDFASSPPRLTLASALTVAYQELTTK